MSTRPNNGVGGIVGGVVAFIVVAAIVASPLYLSPFRSTDAKLNDAIENPIEKVRRAVLSLDENLALMGNVRSASNISGDSKGTPSLSKEMTELLKQSSDALNSVDKEDADRGTSLDNGAIATGAAKAGSDFKSKYLDAHTALLRDAKSAVQELNTAASDAGGSASESLGANRIQSILAYAGGRILRNQAEFEAWQAAELRLGLGEQVDSAVGLIRISKSLTGQVPDQVIKDIAAQIEKAEQEISARKSIASGLKSKIEEGESRIAELESKATAARSQMMTLESTNASIHGDDSEYARLSKEARDAEAESDALRNGTLSDATKTNNDLRGDLLATVYEGGEGQPGVRDLKDRHELIEMEISALEKHRDVLVARRNELSKQRDTLRSQAKASSDAADDQLSDIQQTLAEAEKHRSAASDAADRAIDSFTNAAKFANMAANNAQTVKSDAQGSDAPEGSSQAELNKMIKEDGDTRAAVLCTLGEANFYIALLKAEQIDWLRSQYETEAAIASRTGRSAPADVSSKTDLLRADAIKKADDAKKAFENAGKEIATSRASLADVTVNGKDYKWQAQIGQAAAHLLAATLATTDEERKTEQDAAYALLQDSIQGREQSPALLKAIQTFELLQQTAH